MLVPAEPPTEVVRERSFTYADEPVVFHDDPVVVDDTNYWLWALGALMAVVLLGLLFWTLRDDGDDEVSTATGPVATTPAPQASTPATVVVPAPAAPAPAPVIVEDGDDASSSSGPVAATPSDSGADFQLNDLSIEDDGGLFGGSAVITNTEDSARQANITVTLFKGGQRVGTLRGTTSVIPANSSATVTLDSTDTFVEGVERYEFTAVEV